MNTKPRRGLQDICTRSNRASETDNPQRKFLCLANLELRKALCNKVRDAAKKRIAEMDQQLLEIDEAQARLLQTIGAGEPGRSLPTPPPHAFGDAAQAKPCGFTMKY